MRIANFFINRRFLFGLSFGVAMAVSSGAWAVTMSCEALQDIESGGIDCSASSASEFCTNGTSSAYYSLCTQYWTSIQDAFCCDWCDGTLEGAANELGLGCEFNSDEEDQVTDEVPLNFPRGADGIWDLDPSTYNYCYGSEGPRMVVCDCNGIYVTESATSNYPTCAEVMTLDELNHIEDGGEFDTCTLNPLADDSGDTRRVLCVAPAYYDEGMGDSCLACECGANVGGDPEFEEGFASSGEWVSASINNTYVMSDYYFRRHDTAYNGCQVDITNQYSCEAGYYLRGDSSCQQCPPVEGEVGSSLATTPEYNQSGITSCTVPADLEITDGTGNKYMYVNDCAYTPAN